MQWPSLGVHRPRCIPPFLRRAVDTSIRGSCYNSLFNFPLIVPQGCLQGFARPESAAIGPLWDISRRRRLDSRAGATWGIKATSQCPVKMTNLLWLLNPARGRTPLRGFPSPSIQILSRRRDPASELPTAVAGADTTQGRFSSASGKGCVALDGDVTWICGFIFFPAVELGNVLLKNFLRGNLAPFRALEKS